jgi:glucose-1-phosphate adenylyltransferase
VVVSGGLVKASVLSPGCFVDADANVDQSVLLNNVTVGPEAIVRRAILDKNVVVPAGVRVGVDPDEDRARGLTLTDSGLVVAGKDQLIES